jgi:hypothetical protein
MTEGKDDHSGQPDNLLGRAAAYVAMLIALPVLLLFIYLGKFDRGIAAWICAGFIVGITRARWDSRKNPWFWVAILTAAFLQVPFVMFVPWTKKYQTMMTLLPFGIVDYVVINWCINLAEKLGKRRQPAP